MSNISKTIFFTLVVVILVIAGFKLSNKTQNEEPIIIGAILPQTGIAAIVGETERQGIELAVKEINDEGGVDGRMFRVAFEDDRTDPKETVTAIRKLTSTQDVSAIIGGTWDFLANAAIPVAEAEQVVLISPSALPDTLEKESPYYFVTHSPVSSVESAVKRWLISNNTKRVVLMSVNNLWGQAHLKTFRKATEGQGITILKEIVVPQFDGNDIQRELALIKNLQPDGFVVALNFSDSVSFINRKKTLGIGGKVLGDFHIEDNFKKGNIPASALQGVQIFLFSDPNQNFIDHFSSVYGEKPKTYADTAYDAVYAIKLAIENAGGKTDTASVLKGLKQISDYKGASGTIDFSQANYSQNKKALLKQFTDGQFVEIP